MTNLGAAFAAAIQLLIDFDAQLVEIVGLSLRVSFSALAVATLIGMPLGALVALSRFPGRGVVVAILNALMGLPPVVAGLIVYLLLSRAGPLGELGLLYTPNAMVIVQSLLTLPIVAALSRQTIADLNQEYEEQLQSLRVGRIAAVGTLLREGRYSLLTAVMAGLGRAIGEVGAVIVVGGNINHRTRIITTTIAMDTGKGEFALALGLGLVLVGMVILINVIALGAQRLARRSEGT